MKESVQDYYGKVLNSSEDLKSDACCTDASIPRYLKQALAKVHDEVSARYYGCGLVIPEQLEGLRVLDLGSGSGRDCYVLSQLVGEQGFVLGVDMTDEQLGVANRQLDWHCERFGYRQSNVEFRKGYIEELDHLGLEDESFDLIISNCVINLSPDKPAVLSEAFRLLKPGGEMYFSDVYADRRVPSSVQQDPVLWGECLGGALYWNDFLNLAKSVGFTDPRLVEDRPLTIDNEEIAERLEPARFFSATYRLFKLDGLESHCEDYGQAVRYRGGIPHHENRLQFDKHHAIDKGRLFPVCGNTWRMLHDTRFKPFFDFYGDFSRHYGIFEGCGTALPFDDPVEASGTPGSGCC